MPLAGVGSRCLAAFVDFRGKYFEGGKTYKITPRRHCPCGITQRRRRNSLKTAADSAVGACKRRHRRGRFQTRVCADPSPYSLSKAPIW
jgi:hypothetical protein